jgi:hypothetical protein
LLLRKKSKGKFHEGSFEERRGEERGGEGEREGKRHLSKAKSNASSKGFGVE